MLIIITQHVSGLPMHQCHARPLACPTIVSDVSIILITYSLKPI